MSPVKPLRICMLGYRSDPMVGGQGIYLYHLSRALVDAGHSVDVVSGDPVPNLDPRVRLVHLPGLNLYEHGLLGVSPRALCGYVPLVEWFSKLTGGFAEPWSFCERVTKWFCEHRHDYDIVHDNQSLGSGLLDLSSLGVPVVATIHHPITRDLQLALRGAHTYKQRMLLRRWYHFLSMQRRVARALAHIVTVSYAARHDIIEDFGLDPNCVSVVYNGIDAERYTSNPNIERKKRLLMAVISSEQHIKGLRQLLLACASLVKRFPDLELLLVGKLREDGANRRLITTLGLTKHVRNTGKLSNTDLARYYAQATVVVVPSLYEGFGFPVGEAMACGAPVVCTDGGALAEIAADAALVVPAGQSASLAQGVEILLKDPEYARALGVRGQQRIRQHFCWQRAAERMVTLYERLLSLDSALDRPTNLAHNIS